MNSTARRVGAEQTMGATAAASLRTPIAELVVSAMVSHARRSATSAGAGPRSRTIARRSGPVTGNATVAASLMTALTAAGHPVAVPAAVPTSHVSTTLIRTSASVVDVPPGAMVRRAPRWVARATMIRAHANGAGRGRIERATVIPPGKTTGCAIAGKARSFQ